MLVQIFFYNEAIEFMEMLGIVKMKMREKQNGIDNNNNNNKRKKHE